MNERPNRIEREQGKGKDKDKEKDSKVDCKCMLMSNCPLPDFHVQFSDGTRLKYSLESNLLVIERKADSVLWEGSINVIDDIKDGNDGSHFDCMPAKLRRYTAIAQRALSLCMEGDNLQKGSQEAPVIIVHKLR